MLKRLFKSLRAMNKDMLKALAEQESSRKQIQEALYVHSKLQDDIKRNHYAEIIVLALGVNRKR